MRGLKKVLIIFIISAIVISIMLLPPAKPRMVKSKENKKHYPLFRIRAGWATGEEFRVRTDFLKGRITLFNDLQWLITELMWRIKAKELYENMASVRSVDCCKKTERHCI